MTEIFVPLIVFGSIAYVIKVLSDNRVRSMLIKQGEVNENVKYLFGERFGASVPTSLKWSMVLIAIGAGVMLASTFIYFLMTKTYIYAGDKEPVRILDIINDTRNY